MLPNDAEAEANKIREPSSFTVQLVVGVMRQELRVEKAPGHHVVACCFLLRAMMPSSKPCLWQHVVGSIVTQGVQHPYHIVSVPCKMCSKALSAAHTSR